MYMWYLFFMNKTILRLTRYYDVFLSESHRSVLERLNASQTIVTALLHHEKSDKIHENGQIALTNLSAEG